MEEDDAAEEDVEDEDDGAEEEDDGAEEDAEEEDDGAEEEDDAAEEDIEEDDDAAEEEEEVIDGGDDTAPIICTADCAEDDISCWFELW